MPAVVTDSEDRLGMHGSPRPTAPRSNADVAELRRAVAQVRWFHRIDLGDGVVTPGDDDTPEKLKTLHLPEDLRGTTVLDIGAWDGFFSFEAERRGAARVLATDDFCWGGDGWGTKAGFDLARRALGSKVESAEMGVLELSPETAGVFDLVLFLGVLYHMRHPLLALERVASVTGRQLILETGVDMTWFKKPLISFYPGAEAVGDPTNWCGPNPAAVVAMLKVVGFRRVRVVDRLATLRALARSARQTLVTRRLFLISRYVFHAWRE
jgi:tRNA (mo5U34)-methyltransferase